MAWRGHQCTFVAENGQRCPARRMLEFHHVDPHARGGPSTLSNVTLRCRVHNGHAAEMDYGAELVARRIAEARQVREAVAHENSPRGQSRVPSCSARW